MNVVVIPEDFRNDQYILKPLFTRLFRSVGVSTVDVWVCQDPLLGGVGEALKSDRLVEIVTIRTASSMRQTSSYCVLTVTASQGDAKDLTI